MKPINVDPKDIGLHDTDSSELSASTASNSTLPQLEATDAKKLKMKKKEEEEGAAAVRREESKKRRKKTQERS